MLFTGKSFNSSPRMTVMFLPVSEVLFSTSEVVIVTGSSTTSCADTPDKPKNNAISKGVKMLLKFILDKIDTSFRWDNFCLRFKTTTLPDELDVPVFFL